MGKYDSGGSGNQRLENPIDVSVPFMKILCCVYDGYDYLVGGSGAFSVRKMTFLLFNEAKSTHGSNVDAAAMWMVLKEKIVGERMVGAIGGKGFTNDARKAINELIKLRMFLEGFNGGFKDDDINYRNVVSIRSKEIVRIIVGHIWKRKSIIKFVDGRKRRRTATTVWIVACSGRWLFIIFEQVVFKCGDKVGHGEIVVLGGILAINGDVTVDKLGIEGVGNKSILFVVVIKRIFGIADKTSQVVVVLPNFKKSLKGLIGLLDGRSLMKRIELGINLGWWRFAIL